MFRIIFFLFLSTAAYTQQIRVSGFVLDRERGESIPSATVKNLNTLSSVYTNKEGYFSISASIGESLVFSSVGFRKQIIVVAKSDTYINIRLDEAAIELAEVEVRAENEFKNKVIGVSSLNSVQIKDIPSLFGEPDVLKAFLTTPGVAMVNEISSGFSVRGGKPSQNLILLDGTTVYNQSHLFGLTSNFNPDLVKEAKLYKSYFPSEFGGRASSVLDVTLKEGNSSHIKQEISIGVINSRYLIEGPMNRVNRDKTTFSLGLRSSYLTLFLLPTKLNARRLSGNEYFNYWLYDVSGKVRHSFNDKINLYLGFYHGNDYWESLTGSKDNLSSFKVNWGNFTFSSRLAFLISEKIFLNTQASITTYHHKINLGFKTQDLNENGFLVSSKVNDLELKVYADWYATSSLQVKLGSNFTRHAFLPSTIKASFQTGSPNQELIANEFVTFVSFEKEFNKNYKVDGGLRMVAFDTNTETFLQFEPRVAFRKFSKKNSQFYFTYNRMNQFIHQVSSNSLGLPIDIWIPSNGVIEPEQMDQFDFGYIRMSLGNFKSLGLNVFYKKFSNLLEFQSGVSLLTNLEKSPSEFVERNGSGNAYGLELSTLYSIGNLDFSGSHTYSSSRQQFANINNNKWFYSNFDRPHMINIQANQKWNQGQKSFTINWVYYSGNPISIATKVINSYSNGEQGVQPYLLYAERNNYRLPDYHRLDISFNLSKETRRHRERMIRVGLYNAYNRFNALYVKVDFEYNNLSNINNKVVLKKGAVLPVLPFINYTLKL